MRARLGLLAITALSALSLGACGFAFRATGRNLAQLGARPAPPPVHVEDPRRPDARLAALWVGHATVLVQMDDRFVLTDPVFTDSVGELSPRLVAPGLEPERVPPLAALVVSHMHFDHLSFGSLSLFEAKSDTLFVPPGVRASMPRFAFATRELATWASADAHGVRITAVPVRHVGGRYGIDEAWKRYAFTGYVFEYDGMTVYFGGDSAYDGDAFRATRARFPHIDLAFIPICPIAPREHMKRTHMDPSEALQAFDDLGAARMVPIHFDTFINSDDRPGDCGRVLHEAMAARGLDASRVAQLAIGEERVFVARP